MIFKTKKNKWPDYVPAWFREYFRIYYTGNSPEQIAWCAFCKGKRWSAPAKRKKNKTK